MNPKQLEGVIQEVKEEKQKAREDHLRAELAKMAENPEKWKKMVEDGETYAPPILDRP